MQPEKVAELTAQIVSATLQRGNLTDINAKKVCNYYVAIHQQIIDCSQEAVKEAQELLSGEAI